MPVLNDKMIFDELCKGTLDIKPLICNNVQPGSVDLTLHNVIDIYVPKGDIDIANMSKEDIASCMETKDITKGYWLTPGQIVTGRSAETLKIPQDIIGIVYNRNSWATLGFNASISMFTTPGFVGRKTIVLHNMSPVKIKLMPGMRICQIVFYKMNDSSFRGYKERHDESLLQEIEKPNFHILQGCNKNIDNPLSEFLEESIRKAATRI